MILNEGVNKLTRRKDFLRQELLSTVWKMSVCSKCKNYPQGLICFILVLWRVKVEVIEQTMWKCTWCRDSYFFCRFKNVYRIAIIFWFIIIVYNSNIVWFFIFCLSSTSKNLLRIFHPPASNVNTKFSTFCLVIFIL